jgi:DNA repair exonuclease SbcCD nuclease subunit
LQKILCVGDPHANIKNLDNVRSLAKQISEIVVTERVSQIIILGDLHDTAEYVKTQALNAMYDFFKYIRENTGLKAEDVVYIIGNHCYINNQCFLSTDHIFNIFKEIINVIDTPTALTKWRDKGSIKAVACPYVPNGRLAEALDRVDGWKDAQVIFCHQEFYGAHIGTLISEKGDKWESSWPQAISGHIHDYAQINNNITYVGSPYQISFGESDDKALLLLEVDGSSINYRRIRLDFPRKISIEANAASALDLDMEPYRKDHVRLFVMDTMENIEKIKKSALFKNKFAAAKVIFTPSDTARVVRNAGNASFLTLLSKYVQEFSDLREIFDEVMGEIKT